MIGRMIALLSNDLFEYAKKHTLETLYILLIKLHHKFSLKKERKKQSHGCQTS